MMFLPYIYSVDCVANIWTQGPEPLRLIGLSLSLIFLVIRHQVPVAAPPPSLTLTRSVFGHNPLVLRRPG